MEKKIGNTVVKLYYGDITNLRTDAIVNCANTQLILGGGVAGAIKKKGGPSIQEECRKIGSCRTGKAVITDGGNLYAKHVIHTVGPNYYEGIEKRKKEKLLHNSVMNSLMLADSKQLKSIALPLISTGFFAYPVKEAVSVIVQAVKDFLLIPTSLELIILAVVDEEAYKILKGELR